jgi:hypothetical protein
MNIVERIKRYQLAEKCAAMTPKIVDFWTSVVRNKRLPLALRLSAVDRMHSDGL